MDYNHDDIHEDAIADDVEFEMFRVMLDNVMMREENEKLEKLERALDSYGRAVVSNRRLSKSINDKVENLKTWF